MLNSLFVSFLYEFPNEYFGIFKGLFDRWANCRLMTTSKKPWPPSRDEKPVSTREIYLHKSLFFEVKHIDVDNSSNCPAFINYLFISSSFSFTHLFHLGFVHQTPNEFDAVDSYNEDGRVYP